MKNIIEKLKDVYTNNKQAVTLFGSVAIVMLIIIIVIAIAVKFAGNRVPYEELESRLEKAAYNYLQEHPEELPTSNNPTVVISANTLVENKYIKELKKQVKDSSCTANIIVDYENNDYKYQAYLTCNKYKTEKFVDVIKNNKEISQFGEGLYEMNGELVFRGKNPKNLLELNGELWRIVKIDKKNNIQIVISKTTDDEIYGVWDDNYNTEIETNYGINAFNLSKGLIAIKKIYNRKYQKYDNLLTKYDLCTGKRSSDATLKDGSLECNELIKNQEIGLLPIYDYMNASLDGLCQTTISKECQNYNYLTGGDSNWWTMTGNTRTTYGVYKINYHGEVETDYASGLNILRYVLVLNSDVLYSSGDGTNENPYKVR